MEHVVLVIHLILAAGIIGLVLIQKSEGGGLGIGGGGLGNIATARTTGNILTRLTAIFAALFFVTSITLSVIASNKNNKDTISEQLQNLPTAVEELNAPEEPAAPVAEPSVPISTE